MISSCGRYVYRKFLFQHVLILKVILLVTLSFVAALVNAFTCASVQRCGELTNLPNFFTTVFASLQSVVLYDSYFPLTLGTKPNVDSRSQ